MLRCSRAAPAQAPRPERRLQACRQQSCGGFAPQPQPRRRPVTGAAAGRLQPRPLRGRPLPAGLLKTWQLVGAVHARCACRQYCFRPPWHALQQHHCPPATAARPAATAAKKPQRGPGGQRWMPGKAGPRRQPPGKGGARLSRSEPARTCRHPARLQEGGRAAGLHPSGLRARAPGECGLRPELRERVLKRMAAVGRCDCKPPPLTRKIC